MRRPPRSPLSPYTTLSRSVIAGPPVDLSKYEGKPLTKAVLHEATEDIMRAIADLLGELRGEAAPKELYDHHKAQEERDRKSTRLNSSHLVISYAVFCLKKK